MQDLAPGGQLGAYRIVSVVGRGGMGVVYLAEDAGLERRVALKVLAPQFSADSSFRTRFERESRLAASLDHPNVVPVYEAGEIDGVLFIAMRYVDGPDLRAVLDREGRFEATRAIGISAQLASALDAAHAHGLIHRDVKPANVLLAAGYGSDGGEHVYLSDFGLTKRSASKSGLTQLGQLVGTIDYIAPEQIAGNAIDGRTDIYALGCVFFEMLAGQPPLARDSDLATMAAHLYGPPPSLTALRPDLPPAMDDVVAKVLAKDPNARYSTGAEFVRAARVAQLAAGQPPAAEHGRADATVIVPPVSAAQESMRSPTVLADTSVPPPPSQSAPTVYSPIPVAPASSQPPQPPPPTIPPSASVPPPGIGPFSSGGNAPPYVPAGPPGPPSSPQPQRSVPLALILAAVGLGILLVAGAALAILGSPHATPTVISQGSPTAPASVAPTRIASPTATPSPSPAPTATVGPTAPIPTPTPSPTATPTPSVNYFNRLLSLLVVDQRSKCSEVTLTSLAAFTPLAVAQCPDHATSTTRYFALFSRATQLNSAYMSFVTQSDTGTCPRTVPSDRTWNYGGDPTSLERGRFNCYIANDTKTAELHFTFTELLLFGGIAGDNSTVTMSDAYNLWFNDDWIDPSNYQ